jgi:hypothetical protein
VLDYIRPEMMRDYLTLCVKDLRSAIDEIGYDQLFLKIYGPDVKHPDVTPGAGQRNRSHREE